MLETALLIHPRLSSPLAPAPPKSMSKEWQEASTERAKEQNINPITGMSCISPFQPLLMGADYLAILIFWYDQVSALMDTPERDSSRLKQASRLGDLVVWVDDEDEMNVMRGRVVRAEVCIAYETGFESQDNEVYTWFDSKVQRSVCALHSVGNAHVVSAGLHCRPPLTRPHFDVIESVETPRLAKQLGCRVPARATAAHGDGSESGGETSC